MTVKVSPLAPRTVPDMPPVAGVRLAAAAAGVRHAGRKDVLMVVLDRGTAVAGVFTKSKCPSAPVDWCRQVVKKGQARVLVVNSGNANAFTGRAGRAGAQATARAAAKAAGCASGEVLLASTGVIGEPLPAERVAAVMGETAAATAPGRWMDAARAIMTTDTFAKVATRSVPLGEGDIVINGIAKGAGMIAPDMATMLAFIFTDAPVAPEVLHKALASGVGASFNAVTVDSDTSTSDTVLLFATGKARGVAPLTSARGKRFAAFRDALHALMHELAVQIVRDGEGASKLIRVTVKGAVSKTSARRIAFSIANSPLVKTAVAGQDANWGRVVMAVGKAGEPADRDRLAIWFGPHRVAVRGARDPAYDEAVLAGYMKGDEIAIMVDLRLGKGEDTVWTCDLTHDYITINADYRS